MGPDIYILVDLWWSILLFFCSTIIDLESDFGIRAMLDGPAVTGILICHGDAKTILPTRLSQIFF